MAFVGAVTPIDLSAGPASYYDPNAFNFYTFDNDTWYYGTGEAGQELDILVKGTNLTTIFGTIERVGYFYDSKLLAYVSKINKPVSTVELQLQSGIKGLLSGNDTVVGSNSKDKILGMSGNDFLIGKGGNDTIYGNSGQDVMDGGAGNDRLFGGSSNDTLYGKNGKDLLKGNTGKDTLYGGNNNDKLYGQSGIDTLTGQSGNDRLYGGSSNDTLIGGSGKDRLVGGTGSDHLSGGKGADTFVLQKGKGYDTITYFSKADSFDVIGFNDSKVRAVKTSGDVYLYAGKKDLLAIILNGNAMKYL